MKNSDKNYQIKKSDSKESRSHLISSGRNIPCQCNLLFQRVKLELIQLAHHLAEYFIPGEAVKVEHHKVHHEVVEKVRGDAEEGELFVVDGVLRFAKDAGFCLSEINWEKVSKNW